jgi:hypothetical protein
VNWFVKCAETSSPREAFSAISSALGARLDIFGIAPFLFLGCLPGGYQMVIFALDLMSYLKNCGAENAFAPTNGTTLLRVVASLINQVDLVENFLRLVETYAMFSLGFPALLTIEIEAHVYITVISP